jgi:hypothetical protein
MSGADAEKNFGGGVEKIRIIMVRPLFKNLAPPGILFIPTSKKKKKKKKK